MDWPSHRHHLQKDPRLAAALMEPIDQHLHGHAPRADLSDLGTVSKTTRESTGKMLMLWSKDQPRSANSWFHGKFHGKVEKYMRVSWRKMEKTWNLKPKFKRTIAKHHQTVSEHFVDFHGLTKHNHRISVTRKAEFFDQDMEVCCKLRPPR